MCNLLFCVGIVKSTYFLSTNFLITFGFKRWYLVLKIVQACLLLMSSSWCFISCFQMCNTLQSFYTCFQQLDFFTLPKLEPSENFVGNKCFVIWVIFLLNEFLEVLKYESFKNLFLHVNFTCCQYYCQYFGQCYCQYCCWCCCQYCCQRYCWCYCQCYCNEMYLFV